jgi:hypothetical protein
VHARFRGPQCQAGERSCCERERPPVGEFGDPFIGRPKGVRCLRLDSNEHRLVASLRRLKRRGELERMARDDAIVMIRCGDERLPSVES